MLNKYSADFYNVWFQKRSIPALTPQTEEIENSRVVGVTGPGIPEGERLPG